ncbi:hypothetical protein RJ639_006683 [Escallonia herrerae]|uniref:Uncharacterized protein n=1 Tax=Escallonia herrerae TaxID=1293975 RepID=A0AA88W177_9ASTE|nr:hypothetical protein RJ639_006683 [Escallonia herrerae]
MEKFSRALTPRPIPVVISFLMLPPLYGAVFRFDYWKEQLTNRGWKLNKVEKTETSSKLLDLIAILTYTRISVLLMKKRGLTPKP